MEEQEIYLSDIIAALKRRKRLIVAIVTGTFLAGLLYAVLATPRYTASVTVRAAIEESGGLSNLNSRFGSVASIAGIDLSGGGSNKDEYMAILRSRELVGRFIKSHSLLPHLFPERWDDKAKKWKQPGSGLLVPISHMVSRTLAYFSGDEGWREIHDPAPSDWQAYKEFDEKILKIREEKDTGVISVSFEFRDPTLAASWANAFVELANHEIRDNAVKEASRALEYLNEQATETTVAELRATIYSLIETQLKRIMLANSRPEFAFKIIDKAMIPEDKSYPKRGLIVILSLLLGGAIGIIYALGADAYQGVVARANKERVYNKENEGELHREEGREKT